MVVHKELMFQRFFKNNKKVFEAPKPVKLDERTSGLTYHYLEMYITTLPRDEYYMIREELPSGVIVTHETRVTWEEMRDYVRRVFIPSVPPRFIITAVR